MEGSKMRIYTYEGIPLVHISTFASAVHMSNVACRYMLERRTVEDCEGGARKRRPLKYFRDGSTVWIPVAEITGYPFIKGTNCYHCDEHGNRYLCTVCTFTNDMCDNAKKAAELVMPVGDN